MGLHAGRDLEDSEKSGLLCWAVYLDWVGLSWRANSVRVARSQLLLWNNRLGRFSKRYLLHVPERVDHQTGITYLSSLELGQWKRGRRVGLLQRRRGRVVFERKVAGN